jgi:hypothetical protein
MQKGFLAETHDVVREQVLLPAASSHLASPVCPRGRNVRNVTKTRNGSEMLNLVLCTWTTITALVAGYKFSYGRIRGFEGFVGSWAFCIYNIFTKVPYAQQCNTITSELLLEISIYIAE